LQHFLAAGLELHLAAAQFLQAGPFALQFLLGAFELGELDLFFADERLDLLTGRRPVGFRGGGAGGGGHVTALLGGLKITVNEFSRFMMRRHEREDNAPRAFCKGPVCLALAGGGIYDFAVCNESHATMSPGGPAPANKGLKP
jgi:hypothetical protein